MLPAAAFGHGGSTAAAPVVMTAEGGRTHIGDIAISVERAIEHAEQGRGGQTGDIEWSAGDELRLLVTHGTLHLCGWDHAEPAEEAAMRALERNLLGREARRGFRARPRAGHAATSGAGSRRSRRAGAPTSP